MKKSKLFYSIFLLVILTFFSFSCGKSDISKAGIDRYLTDLPFEMGEVSVPVFSKNSVNIKDFGALDDGHTLNTEAINEAIQTCAEAGGGKVIVPPGMWFTGPIHLKSNINLNIQRGAVLLFSGQFEDYPVIDAFCAGLPMKRCTSPISGWDLENVAITGGGVIDGNGEAWRPVKRWKMTDLKWDALVRSGGVVREWNGVQAWFPSEAAFLGESLLKELYNNINASPEDYAAGRESLRPMLITLARCKNVLLDGPTFQNSPMWNIHLLMSENIVVRNIMARNPWNAQNGDGLDLESCKNVLVYNSSFDVGDDAMCMKSGRNEYGRKRRIPTENVVIDNCIVYHAHTGFAIGSEMSGGVRNILVRNCQFLSPNDGLRFKSTRGRGGIVENIFIENILMEDISNNAIWFDLFYQKKAIDKYDIGIEGQVNTVPPVTEETPQFRKIYINKVICRNAKRAILMEGLPEMAIQDIKMDNLYITSAEGFVGIDIDGIELTNSRIVPASGPTLSLLNSKNVIFENVEVSEKTQQFLRLAGFKTNHIELRGYDNVHVNQLIDIGKEVKLTNELITKGN